MRPKTNARCVIRKETLAGVRGSGPEAPKAACIDRDQISGHCSVRFAVGSATGFILPLTTWRFHKGTR